MSFLRTPAASADPPNIKRIAITVQVAVTDVPPAAISDLTALSGSAAGTVQLRWTAPGEDGMSGTASGYVIRVATTQITAALFNTASTYSPSPPWTPVPGGNAEGSNGERVVSGLTPGVTYYFAIKAFDSADQLSSWASVIDDPTVNRANYAIATSTALNPPSIFSGLSLSKDSVQWSWNASLNASFYQLRAVPSGALIVQTAALAYVETGLIPNTPIAREVRAGNGNGLSSPTAARTVYTLAAVPTNLSVVSVGASHVTLGWAHGGNPNGTQYRVERSLNGIGFTPLTLLTSLSYQDTGLSPQTTYYYRVSAINGDGFASAPSSIVQATTLNPADTLAPDQPLGIKGNLDPTGKAFTLIWEPVRQNSDGSPLTDLSGYNIYRRTTLTSSPTKLNPLPVLVTVFADQVDGQTFYYTVRAIDQNGNESIESLFADSSPLSNVIFLANDGLSSVFMPQSVNDLLRSGYNKYGIALTIRMNEEPVSSNTEIVRSVRLELVRGDNKQSLSDLAFAKPQSVVAVGYGTVGGQVVRGVPSAQNISGSAVTNATPDQLALYWNNGVTWVKVGGVVDLSAQAVKTKSSFLGSYQLRIGARATSLNLEQANVYPRVFTPNRDGFNDRVYFVLENPNNAFVKGEIFDMAGRHVATLPPPSSNTGIGTTLIWDGIDTTGVVVPSGVYVYRIEGEGKTFTGTVAVAR